MTTRDLLMRALLLLVVACGPSKDDTSRAARERLDLERLKQELAEKEARTRAAETQQRRTGTTPTTRPDGHGPGDFPVPPPPPGPTEPSGDPGEVPPTKRR